MKTEQQSYFSAIRSGSSFSLDEGFYPTDSNLPFDDFVISRNLDGSICSKFSDPVWDFSAYVSPHRSNSKFDFFSVPALVREEAKWLMFCIDRFCAGARGRQYSFATQMVYFYLLRNISRYCVEKEILLKNFFFEDRYAYEFIDDYALKDQFRMLRSLVEGLRPVEHLTGIVVGFSDDIRKQLIKKAKETKAGYSQVALIPSRILYNIIGYCKSELEDFLVVSDELESFYRYLPIVVIKRNKKKLNIEDHINIYTETADGNELKNLFLQKGVHDHWTLAGYINHICYCAKYLLHALSGMRDEEVLSLKYDCIEKVESETGRVIRLLGDTTKLVGSKKHVKWVTSKGAILAVEAMQSFARISFEGLSKREYSHQRVKQLEDMPLFSDVVGSNKMKRALADKFDLRRLEKTGFVNPDFVKRMSRIAPEVLRISKSDFDELVSFDPLRDWGNDGFAIGEMWPISSHQFRRSLAVYSAQSSLISLPALAKQLQHLCRDMTFYYRNNASEAKKLFEVPKSHIGAEYKWHKAEADFLSFTFNIRLSEEELRGSMGRQHMLDRPKNRDEITQIFIDRAQTVTEYKKGLRSFELTGVGGCESSSLCLKKLTGFSSACFGCAMATIIPSRLANAVAHQSSLVNSLPDTTPEFRAEMNELNRLEAMLKGCSL